ncbi:MAG TPA: hypothetical protein VEW45_06910, partial [Candidatus Dormibacteraeota bacterium]|nr:hypothetical protein [Candidatus Dormibacteraeota bacterium]
LTALALASWLRPPPVAAHAIGDVFTLPVPLSLYLIGAGLAVAASFVVSVVVVRPAGPVPAYPTLPVAAGAASATSVLLQALGLVWWVGIIVSGYLLDPISPLPAVLFWIGIWVGLPIAAVLLGNPWPSLSPFRTLFGLLERATGLLGLDRLDAGVAYPRWLARWPAVALLFAVLWCELILPDSQGTRMVANLLLFYTLLTLAGMTLFGRVAWLRNAELLEVLLGWFGRIGPLGRRVADAAACAGCAEVCDPARCVDCPECAVAAEPAERRPELRPWFAGLTEVRRAGSSDAAFIVLALAGVTYDGLYETPLLGAVLNPIFVAVIEVLGPLLTIYLIQTGALLAVWLIFLTAFGIATWLTRALHDPGRGTGPLGATAGGYAATLLPIAAGYLIAHYLTLVIQGLLWLPDLLANPLSTVAPLLDWIPVSVIWYLSVGAIVLGHIVAVVLAHRLALRDAPGRPLLAGLPLVILMVGYTVLSLWIIAAPITLEPGITPAALQLP